MYPLSRRAHELLEILTEMDPLDVEQVAIRNYLVAFELSKVRSLFVGAILSSEGTDIRGRVQPERLSRFQIDEGGCDLAVVPDFQSPMSYTDMCGDLDTVDKATIGLGDDE
jgi:hypothetical protein